MDGFAHGKLELDFTADRFLGLVFAFLVPRPTRRA
jgi:hypothetical protein